MSVWNLDFGNVLEFGIVYFLEIYARFFEDSLNTLKSHWGSWRFIEYSIRVLPVSVSSNSASSLCEWDLCTWNAPRDSLSLNPGSVSNFKVNLTRD